MAAKGSRGQHLSRPQLCQEGGLLEILESHLGLPILPLAQQLSQWVPAARLPQPTPPPCWAPLYPREDSRFPACFPVNAAV